MIGRAVTTVAACVCVETVKRCAPTLGGKGGSQDGAATPPRGRGLCPRQTASTTTTTATRSLVSSSSRALCYHVVPRCADE